MPESDILLCNYEISKILKLIQTQFNIILSNNTINLELIPTNIELDQSECNFNYRLLRGTFNLKAIWIQITITYANIFT